MVSIIYSGLSRVRFFLDKRLTQWHNISIRLLFSSGSCRWSSGLLTSAEANEEVSAEITSDATSGTGAAAPDPKNNKNKKNKKKKDDKNYKNYDPEEIEKKYGLEEGEFHNKIKAKIKSIAEQIKNKSGTDKKIVRFVKQNTNPDILFSRNGYIALQSRQTKELIALGITIFELLSKE